jgi:diguanylate cyclase (GGDEF)-like protein
VSADVRLKTWTGAALLFSTTLAIIAASYVPEVSPEMANYWRWGLGVPSLWICVGIVVIGQRMPEKLFQPTVELAMIPALGANVFFLMITPATELVLMNMLVTLIYAGYFVRFKPLLATLGAGILIALSTLFISPANDTPHLGSFLVVYITVMVVMVMMLHLQNSETLRTLARADRRGHTDPLTGLANLHALEKRAAELLVDVERGDGDEKLGLLLVDLDNFKSANSKHGHLGGDHALRTIAAQLLRSAPADALVARVGGDEFAILLTGPSRERIAEYGAVFNGAVRAAEPVMDLPGVTIGASIGVAVHPEDGADLSELLDTADKSMYAAKGAKRHPFPDFEHGGVSAENRPAWAQGEASDEPAGRRKQLTFNDVTGGRVPHLARFSLYARASTFTWLLSVFVLTLSMLMPDAFPDPRVSWWMVLLTGLAIAPMILFSNPDPGTAPHLFDDLASMLGLAAVIWATGGIESPALPLAILITVSQAWFWGTRMVAFRLIGPLLVVASPLFYTAIGNADKDVIAQITLAGLAVVVMILVGAMYADRAVLASLQRRADRLAATDALTGVANRRSFESFVQRLISSGPAPRFAIVILDLDNFKQVNTERGHRAGDQVLAAVAQAFKSTARTNDCVARIGGDEFAVVLPGVGTETARSLAQRFVNAVEETPEASSSGVGASAGFAFYPEHGNSLDALVFTADSALMAVKASGKGSARMAAVVPATN